MIEYDPRRAEIIADPYPTFRVMRVESPVHWSDILGGWILTRYEDVKMVIADRRFSANRMRPFFERLSEDRRVEFAELARSISGWAVFHDPPDHTRLRSLMNKAFTNAAVEKLAGSIRRIISQLLDRIDEGREVDLISEFAYPLPASVILEMLGLPLDDLDLIKIWSDELALFVGSSLNAPDRYRRAAESMTAMNNYFREAIDRHRRQPRPDLLTALIAAHDKGETLSEEELLSTCVLLVFAGHETTTNLIGNGLLTLLRHPEALANLRRHPEGMELAVEELLRYEGPAASAVRIATESVRLGGKTMNPGDRVFAMLHAANRDPAVFADPDRLDLARRDNRHLAFGHGIHFCLGAPLARLEGQLAIQSILHRFTKLRLADEMPMFNDSLVLRGLTSLVVRCE